MPDTTQQGAPLTVDDLAHMAEIYTRTLSIRATARIGGWEANTVLKYVNHGDPSRGIPSIKSQLATSVVRIPEAVPAGKYLEKTVTEATQGSKAILRAVKELFGLKLTHMLKSFDEAYASGDEKQVKAVHEKYDRDLRFKDLPRILDVEQQIWGQSKPREDPSVPKDAGRKEKIAAIKSLLKDSSLLLNQHQPSVAVQSVCDECGQSLNSQGECPTCEDPAEEPAVTGEE